jgi:hypothetical protein
MRAALGIAIILASSVVARSQSLQEQSSCAKQAEKAYQDYIGGGAVAGFKLLSSDYESHYNSDLKRCLVLIDEVFKTNEQTSSSTTLVDAFERHTFAQYMVSGANRLDCELAPALKKSTSCSSRAEFDAFVSEYMQR